jgi:hypothetical protein
MELKQFITEALLNIVDGIEEANKTNSRFKIIGVKHESGIDGNFVDFDVSVVVNESSSGKMEGKIDASFLKVVSASVDSKTDQTSTHQNAHRLIFKVYISEKKLV